MIGVCHIAINTFSILYDRAVICLTPCLLLLLTSVFFDGELFSQPNFTPDIKSPTFPGKSKMENVEKVDSASFAGDLSEISESFRKCFYKLPIKSLEILPYEICSTNKNYRFLLSYIFFSVELISFHK